MREYGQYCPIARAAEVLGDRWTPLIIRELLAGSHHFSQLRQGLPGISRSVLADRLRYLERREIIVKHPAAAGVVSSYGLTPAGLGLRPVVDTLGEWGAEWSFGEPLAEELDAALLMFWIRRRIELELLPSGTTVIHFIFARSDRTNFWLLIRPPEVSICLDDPGFATNLTVRAELATFYQIWMGRCDLRRAIHDGVVVLEGPAALRRAFPGWLKLSHKAPAVARAMAAS
jgi:DNA-binding HxlR family transcriptional regulator